MTVATPYFVMSAGNVTSSNWGNDLQTSLIKTSHDCVWGPPFFQREKMSLGGKKEEKLSRRIEQKNLTERPSNAITPKKKYNVKFQIRY